MAKTPSSFADTLSSSSRSGTSSHTSATSETWIDDYKHKVDFDIIEDDDDEECGSLTFIKSLGPRFRGVEDLVTHPKPGTDDVNIVDLEAPASVISDFDYEAEHADYKHTRGILREMGGECEELATLPYNHAYFRTEMPDGSKVIMKKFHDAYIKHHTGYPALQGEKVSDELQQEFEDRACDVSKHRPHLLLLKYINKIIVDDEEPRLNIGCSEYPRESAMVWNEDFDEIPLPLEEERIIVGLVRSGGQRTVIYEKMKVRKDTPGDPMAFSSCRKGIEAARVLADYQNDDEQIERGAPIPDSDRPYFEGKLALDELPEGPHEHLHDLPGQNDSFIHRVLNRLENLRAEPDEYDRQVANKSNEYATGSGITTNRNGLEEDIIIGVWDSLNHDEVYSATALRSLGLLNSEDDFGDNPEYVKAKKLWWEQKLGIRGMEAIVRYHMQRLRALRRPNREEYFLSEYEETYGLNYDSPEYPAPRREIEEVSEDCQVYDALHASPVDWTAKCGSRIRLWRLSVTDVVPHNDFGDGEGCRRAYDALAEYQDS
jgi:hypothetical protein